MAVAWIGNREALVEHAVEHAAALLHSSRCPVFTFDTDIHGTRAAIALAERVGAAYDHETASAALARETALFTDKGGMLVSPGEVRRRADVVVLVGALPDAGWAYLTELANNPPDPGLANERAFFVVGDADVSPIGRVSATRLSCDGGLPAALAALRGQHAGRALAGAVSNHDTFARALAEARFPVFLFSGDGCDPLSLEMLQGFVSDLNRTSRASALHLPASGSGWGSALASTWMTGFPLRTGFARGFPEYDPWRFDAARMLADGEADLHLRVRAQMAETGRPSGEGAPLIALERTEQPASGAEVTIATGEPGIDHESVAYSGRTGTLVSAPPAAASDLPSAAALLRSMIAQLPAGEAAAC